MKPLTKFTFSRLHQSRRDKLFNNLMFSPAPVRASLSLNFKTKVIYRILLFLKKIGLWKLTLKFIAPYVQRKTGHLRANA